MTGPTVETVDSPSTADRGRSAVGEAEEAAFGGTDLDELHDRIDVEGVVDDVVNSSWWATAGPPIKVITPRRSARSSSTRFATVGSAPVEIRLTDEQLTLATAAHELAHALAGVTDGHGARFRAAYVDLTALLAGADAAQRLAAAFDAFGIPPGTRTWPAPYRAEGPTFRLIP